MSMLRANNTQSITIFDGIFAAANRTPQKIAITENNRALTYAKLTDRIVRVANMTRALMGENPGRAAVSCRTASSISS